MRRPSLIAALLGLATLGTGRTVDPGARFYHPGLSPQPSTKGGRVVYQAGRVPYRRPTPTTAITDAEWRALPRRERRRIERHLGTSRAVTGRVRRERRA